MSIRIVFMGSPDFALPTLRSLAGRWKVAGVVTQPDRRAGRGKSLAAPPVKTLALELGLPVIQPARLKDPEVMAQLRSWAPDLIVVAAYGQILRPDVLDLPPKGCLNVHASLLPRWRGASPVHHAILHGDRRTGVSIMRMDPGLDTGPVISQSAVGIGPEETAGELTDRLADLGASLLVETLPGYLGGTLLATPQEENKATYAPMLKKEDGALDFNAAADELARRVRAFNPWPGTHFEAPGGRIKVHRARAETGEAPMARRIVIDGLPAVGTAQGVLVLEEVQPEGRSVMRGADYLSGARDWTESP